MADLAMPRLPNSTNTNTNRFLAVLGLTVLSMLVSVLLVLQPVVSEAHTRLLDACSLTSHLGGSCNPGYGWK